MAYLNKLTENIKNSLFLAIIFFMLSIASFGVLIIMLGLLIISPIISLFKEDILKVEKYFNGKEVKIVFEVKGLIKKMCIRK